MNDTYKSETIVNYQLSSIKEKIHDNYFELKSLFSNDKSAKILTEEEFKKAFDSLLNLQKYTTEYNTLLNNKDESKEFESSWDEVSSEESNLNEEIVHANSDETFYEDIDRLQEQSDYEMETFGKLKSPDITISEDLNRQCNKVEVDLSNIPEGMNPSDFGFEKIESKN